MVLFRKIDAIGSSRQSLRKNKGEGGTSFATPLSWTMDDQSINYWHYNKYMHLSTDEETHVQSKTFAIVITIDQAQLPEGRTAEEAKVALRFALNSHEILRNSCRFFYFSSNPEDRVRLFFPAHFPDDEIKIQLFAVLALLNHEILKATKGGPRAN
ncbi:hypothetical protein niasHS_013380 [Heterodera schachtii]|uniref:Uncharacterized protein n=1 Tax=Heterodera schachtii TaxID=97005 RepID=A0ABD2I4M6_HETSC